MVNSYDDMQGTPMDVENHPAYDKPDATQHYAGDVLPLNAPQTGLGGAANQIRNQGTMRDIASKGSSAVDTTNLAKRIIRPFK